MIYEGETIRGPLVPGGPTQRYIVTRVGRVRKDGGQRVTARGHSEGVGGSLVEATITLDFPDPENITPWEVVGNG